MFEVSEEMREYSRAGSRLEKDFQKQVSDLVLAERLSHRWTVSELCSLTGVPADWIEKQELRRKKLNWCIVAALLKFYKKRLVVSLADEEETQVDSLVAG